MLFYSEFKEVLMVSAGDWYFAERKYCWLLNSSLRVKQPWDKGIPDTAKQKRKELPQKIKVKSNTSVLKDDKAETLGKTGSIDRKIQLVINTASHPGLSHTRNHHLY